MIVPRFPFYALLYVFDVYGRVLYFGQKILDWMGYYTMILIKQ